MSMAFTVGGFTRSFSVRLFGFDRQQVIGFCSHIANDYERTVRELEQSRQTVHSLQAARPTSPAALPAAQTASQGVERILASAQRIAEEMESDAKTEAARMLAEAKTSAAGIVREAEQTAAGILDEARREAEKFGEQVAVLRRQYAGLRAAFERAADTAASALGEIAAHEHSAPDLSAGDPDSTFAREAE